MPRTPNETKQRQFRLDEDTLADLKTISDWLTSEFGYEQTRTDAVRYAAREAAKKIRKKSENRG